MQARLTGLEALRGIAAVLVAFNHMGFIAGYPHAASALFAKSYLAVDLFFLLSGYVLARTYEGRMAGALAFTARRFARLWPPVAAGVVLGALLFAAAGLAPATFAFYLLTGLAILPLAGWAIPFNHPAWSIFFELVANWAHALVFRRLPSAVLLLAVGGCAVALTAGAGPRGLDVGQGALFWPGFLRVAMSYLLGIVLWRTLGDRPRTGVGLARLAVLGYPLLIVLAGRWLLPQAEPAFVLLTGPAILVAALALGPSRAAVVLGAFSFPLYALHYPIQTAAHVAGLGWAAGLAGSFALAALIGTLVDPRWRAMLRRTGKATAPGAAGAGPAASEAALGQTPAG